MATYVSLIVGCILVNNFVLTQILGICPFLGVSKSTKTALGMGGAVVFVMTISGFFTACIYHFLLVPYKVEYLSTIVFILAIAGIVQIVEILRRPWRGRPVHPEGLRACHQHRLLLRVCGWLCLCAPAVFQHPRASGACQASACPQGASPHADHCGAAGHGVHGILRTGELAQ